ncbi:MAG: UDP-N-acetylglucosamine 2-epimerase [Candidatus Pacebacteria bacterium]|nr:UDP-N-acetylglucosamine 2-epimerase [Candidatus Paceibacterota bacterium]
MRKILYISGTRADYGLMRETLFQIKKNPKLKIEIAATGMHLMPEFGLTIDEIKKDGFKIHKVNAIYKKDDKESMASFIGELIQLLTKEIKKIKPDIVLLLGDRGEMLSGAIAGSYLTIPVAHIGGGDISGTIDELARHAITKLSHIHFPVTENSAKRIQKMGEESWRIFKVSAPGLDDILNEKLFSEKEISKKYKLNLSKPILLVVQHAVTTEINEAAKQIKETLEAIRELGFQTILIYPNADAGGREMIKVINEYKKYPFIKIYKSIPRKDYLSLMKISSVLIGNSSSGVIEAPSFHLPMVNIGKREIGRERTRNVIDTNYNKEEIKKAIERAIHDKKFKESLKKIKNPYGNGNGGKKIADILAKIKIDKKLLEKKIIY